MNRILWLVGLATALRCANFSNGFPHLSSFDHGEPAKLNVISSSIIHVSGVGHQNFEELGSDHEGDILLPVNKNALVAKTFRWPRNKVPYVLNGNFTPQDLATIQWAFDQFNNKTCVHFQERFKEKDYVSIVSGNSGCWSNAGRVGGKQEVNLQSPECFLRRGTVLHEFMHALGFMHEHNRHDRDNYIIVNIDNVKDNQTGSFVKLPKRSANGMGLLRLRKPPMMPNQWDNEVDFHQVMSLELT